MSELRVSDELVGLAAALRASLVPLGREFRRVDDGRLTPTQLSVLGSIMRNGPVSIGRLAELERLSPPTVSKVIVTLEDEHLVVRVHNRQDRRVCQVAVSDAGQAWIAAGRAERNAVLAARLAVLSDHDRAVLEAATPILERLAHTPDNSESQ